MKIRETFNTAAHIKELEHEVIPNGITCNIGILKNYRGKKICSTTTCTNTNIKISHKELEIASMYRIKFEN